MDDLSIPWGEILSSAGGTGAVIVGVGYLVWRKLIKIDNALTQLAAKMGHAVTSDGNVIPVSRISNGGKQ